MAPNISERADGERRQSDRLGRYVKQNKDALVGRDHVPPGGPSSPFAVRCRHAPRKKKIGARAMLGMHALCPPEKTMALTGVSNTELMYSIVDIVVHHAAEGTCSDLPEFKDDRHPSPTYPGLA